MKPARWHLSPATKPDNGTKRSECGFGLLGRSEAQIRCGLIISVTPGGSKDQDQSYRLGTGDGLCLIRFSARSGQNVGAETAAGA